MARRCEATEGIRRTQKIVTIVSVGLIGLSRTREVQVDRRKRMQKKKHKEKEKKRKKKTTKKDKKK